MAQTLERAEPRLSWRSSPGLIALALALGFVSFGAQARDVEAVVIGLGLGLGTWLLGWRRGLVGRIVLGLLCLNTLVWMLPAAYSNVRHGDPLLATTRSTALAALGLVGIVSVVLARRSRLPVARVLVGCVVAVGAVVGVSRLPGVGTDVKPQPDDLRVSIRTSTFSSDQLVVEGGTVGVAVKNHDVFWHTFTIDELDVDLRLPNGATRRVELDAEPGSYEFVCAIPGHEQAGMKGTLLVR